VSYATANGVPLVGLRLFLPREGVWHGELTAAADAPLDFALSISVGGVRFNGTATRSGLVEGTAVAEFRGGAGGMHKLITPRAYRDVALSVPLRDIAKEAGEELAANSMRDVTDVQLGYWTSSLNKAGHAINSLVRLGASAVKGATWRVRPDGKLWVGVDGWSEVKPAHQLLTADLLADRAIVSMEEPTILPGTTFYGRRVSYVEHVLRDSALRSFVWFE
jgi:hypothetical protein